MLLRRITEHIKDQNWFVVAIDFLIVVVGAKETPVPRLEWSLTALAAPTVGSAGATAIDFLSPI